MNQDPAAPLPATAASGHFTRRLAVQLVALREAPQSAATATRVQHCLIDWCGAAIAGANEPVARIVRDCLPAGATGARATLIGDSRRMASGPAALANAAAAHALELDSSTMWALSHACTPAVATALALGEELDATGEDVSRAIVTAVEAACVIGLATMRSTDTRGWHQTGVTGVFAAAAAAGALLRFDAQRMSQALALAATQAAGLRAVFGTMGKCLNAGKPAQDGILAARLVHAGFTAPEEAIDNRGGFAGAFAESFDPDRPEREMRGRLGIESTVYKYHANCHGTHATIDAIRGLRARYGFAAADVRGVQVQVPSGVLRICGIADPRDAHESQFSLTHAAALALAGESTMASGFTAEKLADPLLRHLRACVQVVPFPGDLPTESPVEVAVQLAAGALPAAQHDGFQFTADAELPAERGRLEEKFLQLVASVRGAPRAAALLARLQGFSAATPVRKLMTEVGAT